MQRKMLHLPEVCQVHCRHVQIRNEHHGDDLVRAIDMAFYIEGGNELLDHFDEGLRLALYCNRDADQGQETIPGAIAVLPHLRVPDMKGSTIKWLPNEKWGGYRLIVDYGVGGEGSDVDLTGCVLAKRTYTVNEPHARIDWRVSYAGLLLDDEAIRGRLTGLVDQDCWIRLIPPANLQLVKGAKPKAAADDGQQGTLEEDGEQEEEGGEGGPEEGANDPTGAFLQQHGSAAAG
jgi:hypothetical protein